MSGFKIRPAAKPILRKASRTAIQNYFVGVEQPQRSTSWLLQSNRYRVTCTKTFEADVKAAKTPAPARNLSLHKHRQLRAYVGASGPAHVIDAWSFLGRAVDATLRGDTYSAVHFSYYAELRAAMALLGSEGIGVFSGIHAIVDEAMTAYFPRTGHAGTHSLVWPLLRYWSTLSRSADLFDLVVQPDQWPLSTWLSELNCPVRVRAIGQGWLSSWGIDLAATTDDHDARNFASYRPSEFRRPAPHGTANIVAFLVDLWSLFEPGADRRFHSTERHLLKLAWSAGGSPLPAQADMEHLGFTPNEAAQWLQFLAHGRTPIPIELAGASVPIDHPTCHLRMISRAALLLFLASGSVRNLLQASNYTLADLQFWWRNHGIERGLWSGNDTPDDPLDTWADVNESLEEVNGWVNANEGASIFDLRSFQNAQIDMLGAFERAGIWSLLP